MIVRPTAVLASFVLLAIATSGCLAGDSQVFGPGDSGGTATGTNEFGNGLSLSMQAAPARGAIPLAVTFTLKATGAPANASWSLDFGDGSPVHEGIGLPAELQHTYRKAGAFVVLLQVEDGLDGSRATLGIDALAPKVSASAPTSTSSSPTPRPTTTSSPPSPTTSTTTTSATTTSATTTTAPASTTSQTSTTTTNTTSASNSTTPAPGNTTTSTTTTAPASSSTTTTAPPSDTNTTTAAPPPSNTTSETQTTTASPPPDPTATDTQTTSATTTTTTEPQA